MRDNQNIKTHGELDKWDDVGVILFVLNVT